MWILLSYLVLLILHLATKTYGNVRAILNIHITISHPFRTFFLAAVSFFLPAVFHTILLLSLITIVLFSQKFFFSPKVRLLQIVGFWTQFNFYNIIVTCITTKRCTMCWIHIIWLKTFNKFTYANNQQNEHQRLWML